MDSPEIKFEAIFETNIEVTKDTYNELMWKFIPKVIKIIVPIILLGCVLSAIGGYYEAITGIIMTIVFILALIYFQKREIKIQLQRQQEREGTPELKLAISFSEDKIKSHNLRAGGAVYVDYDSIAKFVETKNYYVLRTKANQNIIINKAAMIQTQTSEDFIRFLKDKCKNVKWRSK